MLIWNVGRSQRDDMLECWTAVQTVVAQERAAAGRRRLLYRRLHQCTAGRQQARTGPSSPPTLPEDGRTWDQQRPALLTRTRTTTGEYIIFTSSTTNYVSLLIYILSIIIEWLKYRKFTEMIFFKFILKNKKFDCHKGYFFSFAIF